VTQEDAISNYSGCDSSQTIFVLGTWCAALRKTNVRCTAPRRMTAVAFLDMIPNHPLWLNPSHRRRSSKPLHLSWTCMSVCGAHHI